MKMGWVVLVVGLLVTAGCEAQPPVDSSQTEISPPPIEEMVEAPPEIETVCPEPDGFEWTVGEPKTVVDLKNVLEESINTLNAKGGVQRDMTSSYLLLFNPQVEPYFTYAEWEWDPNRGDFAFIQSMEADKFEADALPGIYRQMLEIQDRMDPESENFDEATLAVYENVGSADGFFFFSTDPASPGPVAITLNSDGLVSKICTSEPEAPMKNFELTYGLSDLELEVFLISVGKPPGGQTPSSPEGE